MSEVNNQQPVNPTTDPVVPSPDFTRITEKPQKKILTRVLYLVIKVLLPLLFILLIAGLILGLVYYNNVKQAYGLSFTAKANLEKAVHQLVNRDFQGAAVLIKQSNTEFGQAKKLLDDIIIVRYIPYLRIQMKTVDQLLISGLALTASGEKVVLLINDIVAPLQNESITYATITTEQKKDILNKIVQSEELLYQVKQQIDEASAAIDAIPEEKLVKPLREGVAPLKTYIPRVKELIDHALPMLKVIPKVIGFEEPKTYLFLLQNNHELRPTGGFIGTYGILKLQDGEIKQFDTDNIYNLDRAPQYLLQEPSPWPIAKYLEQKYWSIRDINWSPDFPTTAEKALYMYDAEYKIWQDLKDSGKQIVGEENISIADIMPYEPNIDGVIAMTPEVIEGLLKVTGPIVVNGRMFNDENLQDELEYIVGREFRQLNIPISERKDIIKKLADQITLKLTSLPLQRVVDILEIGFESLDEKQILLYLKDSELEKLVLERGWGGDIKNTEADYLFVVDSNLASLKTDQYVRRLINYSFAWQGKDLIAKVQITYRNEADFTWKSTRLRSYTRVYVPLGSELIKSEGAMENDKTKDAQGLPGQVEVYQEFNKTVFGAFISIEPHESGTLSFEYKLPDAVKQAIDLDNYNLLVQKQPGVIHDLTLDLNFGKTIKSATPAEQENEWFNKVYNYSLPVNKDLQFNIILK